MWATGDESEYTIHEDGRWVAPPWMTTEGIAYVNQQAGSSGGWLGETFAGPDEEIPLPTCGRIDEDVDLTAEGLDIDTLQQRLRLPEMVSGASAVAGGTEAAQTDSRTSSHEAEARTNEGISSEAMALITARLDAIESQLEGTTYTAQVVDAGDEITLLRIFGEIDREHGQTVEVTVRNGSESDE